MSPYSPLATRIRQALTDLARTVERSDVLMQKAAERGDADYLDGVALSLHGFYTGVEGMLEAIAREVDQTVPQGPDWQRDLLLQVAGALGRIRPAVIGAETRHCLDTYRGFRHVVRNVYTYNLDAARVTELGRTLGECFRRVVSDLASFADFLDDLDSSSG